MPRAQRVRYLGEGDRRTPLTGGAPVKRRPLDRCRHDHLAQSVPFAAVRAFAHPLHLSASALRTDVLHPRLCHVHLLPNPERMCGYCSREALPTPARISHSSPPCYDHHITIGAIQRSPALSIPHVYAMPLRYWTFVAFTLALTSGVAFVTYRTAQLLRRWQPDRNLLLLPGENIVRLLLIATCIGLGLLSGLPPADLGWVLVRWPEALVTGLLLGVAMAVCFYAATSWVVARSGEKHYSRVVLDAILPRDRREAMWTALAMVGVVALEELLFRSLLIGGLRPILPAWFLLAATSVGFGLLHLPQGRWGVGGAAIAGALLGLIFLSSASIVTPIAAHYMTNMVQIGQAMRIRRRHHKLDG